MMHGSNKSQTMLFVSCLTALAIICPGVLTGCQAHKAAYSGFLGDYLGYIPAQRLRMPCTIRTLQRA